MDFSKEWVGRSGQGLREKEDGVSEVHGISKTQTLSVWSQTASLRMVPD